MVVPPGEGGRDGMPIREDHPFDLSIRERVARAVATLVYYHKESGSWAAASRLHEEALPLQVWLSSGSDEGLKVRVLALIEAELRERYDEAVARSLHQALVRSLGDAAGPEETSHRNRQG
jgi:hypothetical protein